MSSDPPAKEKEARLLYKCRMCGGTFYSSKSSLFNVIRAVQGAADSRDDLRYGLHHHKDGSQGLGDLTGLECVHEEPALPEGIKTVTRYIDVAQEFTRHPGGRFRKSGVFSGEMFREDVLAPALKASEKVVVDLNNLSSCPPVWVDEALGPFKEAYAAGRLRVHCTDDADLMREINDLFKTKP
jgi:hypothetical protein